MGQRWANSILTTEYEYIRFKNKKNEFEYEYIWFKNKNRIQIWTSFSFWNVPNNLFFEYILSELFDYIRIPNYSLTSDTFSYECNICCLDEIVMRCWLQSLSLACVLMPVLPILVDAGAANFNQLSHFTLFQQNDAAPIIHQNVE